MVVVIIFGFGSRLCEGKVLALLTSVVLNGNLLIRLGIKSVVLICLNSFYLISELLIKGEKSLFFIIVLDGC
jgi:hypothetical protein